MNPVVYYVTLAVLLAVVLLLAFIVWRLLKRQMRLEKKYRVFMQGSDGKDLEDAFFQLSRKLDTLNRHQKNLQEFVEQELCVKLNMSLYKTHLLRYDAFDGAGGQMSFVLALLDEQNNGYVFNHIFSKDGSSIYGKTITGGKSQQRLTDEEQEAISAAIGKA